MNRQWINAQRQGGRLAGAERARADAAPRLPDAPALAPLLDAIATSPRMAAQASRIASLQQARAQAGGSAHPAQRMLKPGSLEFGKLDPAGRGGTWMSAEFVYGPSSKGNASTVAPPIFNGLPKEREGIGSLYKLGHLLNADLGGDGADLHNIAVLTSSANTRHYYDVEKAVKHQESQLLPGDEFSYDVRVEYPALPASDGPNVFEAQLATGLHASCSEPILGATKKAKKRDADVEQQAPHWAPGATASGELYEPRYDLAALVTQLQHWTQLPPEFAEFEDVARMMDAVAPMAHGLSALKAALAWIQNADAGKQPLFAQKPTQPTQQKQKATEWKKLIEQQALGYERVAAALQALKSVTLAAKAAATALRFRAMAAQLEKYE